MRMDGWMEQLFVVWTDHKNLEYICSAEWLNLHQARLALSFTVWIFPSRTDEEGLHTVLCEVEAI